MKVTVCEAVSDSKKDISFPYLALYTNNSYEKAKLIVMFTSEKSGVCIQDLCKPERVGFYYTNWVDSDEWQKLPKGTKIILEVD